MADAGRLLASGRDGDIYELGPGLVLRRAKDGRVIEAEARVISYAAEHGYPVPQIHEIRAGGTEIVMERLDGPMMMDDITRHPWTLVRNARVLAELHEQLHEITAPDWLRQLDGNGDRLLHLDLHPMNIMMTKRGPVVIDWTNAARGEPLTDVGLTYVLMTCATNPMPPLVRMLVDPFRRTMTNVFALRFRGPAFDEHVALAAELKMFDPNMLPEEIENCRRLAARMRGQ
jgi:aminoglycoside phosphotransferase (APT) family kinase protein